MRNLFQSQHKKWYVEKLYVEKSQPQNKKGGAETVSAVRLHGTLRNLSAWYVEKSLPATE